MTRLLTSGYETGDLNEAGVSNIGSNGLLSVVATVPTPRAGAYCLKAHHTPGNVVWAATFKGFTLAAAKTDVWVRFAFLAHGLEGQAIFFASLRDSLGAVQTSLQYNPADGLIRACRGVSTGQLIGTSTVPFGYDTWVVLEWRTQITSTTAGVTEVWLNGTRVVNVSGDNTQTTTTNVQSLQLGPLGSLSSATAPDVAYLAFDDIGINDTAGTVNNARPGDGRVLLLTPSGAGSSTQLARGGTDTGANFSQVNEVPPSMTQYVSSATVGERDLYAMSDLAIPVTGINVVEAVVFAQNSDVGPGSVGLTIKSGATTNEATALPLSTSAGYLTARWETDPNTGTAWTAAGVNAVEAGVTIR